jgi:hypothetical protein
MLQVEIRFFTNNLPGNNGAILPRQAWAKGVVMIQPNELLGIKPRNRPIPFNSLIEIPSKIEKILARNEITLHLPLRMRKYLKHSKTE